MIRFKSCFKKKKVGRDGDQASLAVSLIQFLTGQDGLKYIVVTRGWIILATRDQVIMTALSPWCAKRLLSSYSSVLDSRLNVFDGQERESTLLKDCGSGLGPRETVIFLLKDCGRGLAYRQIIFLLLRDVRR